MDVVKFPKSRSTEIEGNKERHMKETWRRHPVVGRIQSLSRSEKEGDIRVDTFII